MRCYVFFLFKQKTAYEMRISDWSSDVCSSDFHQPFLGDELVEHRLGVLEQATRAFAHDLVVEDRGIGAGQLPGAEEGGPVDRLAQIVERPVVEAVDARLLRRGGDTLRVERGGIAAGLAGAGKGGRRDGMGKSEGVRVDAGECSVLQKNNTSKTQ